MTNKQDLLTFRPLDGPFWEEHDGIRAARFVGKVKDGSMVWPVMHTTDAILALAALRSGSTVTIRPLNSPDDRTFEQAEPTPEPRVLFHVVVRPEEIIPTMTLPPATEGLSSAELVDFMADCLALFGSQINASGFRELPWRIALELFEWTIDLYRLKVLSQKRFPEPIPFGFEVGPITV